eukprot:GILI01023131.1.p1 GENE.GILI01023131.1~~GILI01023131.1.p1  ORF type:complete len:280 (+),score=17.66 GILI01023131.1:22-840(+)
MQKPSHSPREFNTGDSTRASRFAERPPVITTGTWLPVTPRAAPVNNEYLYFYDDWVIEHFDAFLGRFPFLERLAASVSSAARYVQVLAFRYYAAHSLLVHSLTFFCFLSSIIAVIVAFCMGKGLTAFTVPAHHHKWSLVEKAKACHMAAFYYFIIGCAAIIISWAQPNLSRAKIYEFWQGAFRKRNQRYGRRVPHRRDSSSSESELQPSITHSRHLSNDSGLHNRSGTASGYSSSSSHASPGPRPVRASVPGRIKKEHLALIGLKAETSFED